ncbi:metallophosphoesterase family protein [Methylobacterium radiotolerans]|uniref:metallophosphoesterase family protein n=1 Tax=Methylobacterium radiotolerans TaxID=31998 RepID=UPI0038CF7CE0
MSEPYTHPGVGRFSPLRVHTPVYACGDLHGRRDLLDEFLRWVGDDRRPGEAVTLVFLGDYVDRGPESRQVVERLMRGPERPGETWIPLRGNHDRMFVEAWHDPEGRSAGNWAMNGGLATSASYGAFLFEGFPRLVPEAHIAFLEGLHLAVDDGERLYCHAGVRPGLGIEWQDEHDLTWIREPFLDERHALDRLIVHGHTISTHGPDAKPWRLGIDTGAYATGRLTGVRFDPGNPIPRVWQSGVGPLHGIETPWVRKAPGPGC